MSSVLTPIDAHKSKRGQAVLLPSSFGEPEPSADGVNIQTSSSIPGITSDDKRQSSRENRRLSHPALATHLVVSGLVRMPGRTGTRCSLYQEPPAMQGSLTGDSDTGATAKSDSDSRTRAGTVRSPAARLLVGDGRPDGDPPDRRADLDEPFRVLRGMFTSHPWSLIPGFIPLSVAALIPQALPRSSGSAGSGCVAYLEWSSPITWPSIDSGVSSIDCR